jgi:Cu-Zn family superoxide dismutase
MKKIFIGVLTLGLLLGTASCKENSETETPDAEMEASDEHSHDDGEMHSHEDDAEGHDHEAMNKTVVIAMGSKNGSDVSGTITLKQSGNLVMMSAELSGLSQEGVHAIHIHENGDCSSDDGKSAGGHWNPTEEAHGKWGDHAHHSGDIGNLETNADGNATLTFNTNKWCLGCDDESKNVIGKSFIVHASADDFKSQPSGAAGARIACGVIE